MTNQHRPSLLGLLALLLCTLLHKTAWSHRGGSSSDLTSSSEVRGRNDGRTASNWLKQISNSVHGNHSHDSKQSAELKETADRVNSFSANTSRDNNTSVTSERSETLRPDEGVSPICAYRVIEGGIWGELCFRNTLFGYKCHKSDCRTAVSLGTLVANILLNGSVLFQWTHEGDSTVIAGSPASRQSGRVPGTNATQETSKLNTVYGERRHRRGGYELSCWWNGSFTQFECASVHLGLGCRDFLLVELHENIPYRICLRSLTRSGPDARSDQRDCVDFTLPPSGMQDIVIAMTTVGGAICVMLVIICLLVAYITENIMSPTTQQAHPYRAHSRH